MSYELTGWFNESTKRALCESIRSDWKLNKGPGVYYKTQQNVIPQIEDIRTLESVFSKDRWHNAMFICIPPDGKVPLHTESCGIGINDKGPWFKYQIVLQTNDKAISTIDGEEFDLEENSIYKIDFKLPHESINNGTQDRIHLVMDIYE